MLYTLLKCPFNITLTLTKADRLAPPTKSQLAAQAQMKESAEATRLRKLNTRGKIIIGGALLNLVGFGSKDAAKEAFERFKAT